MRENRSAVDSAMGARQIGKICLTLSALLCSALSARSAEAADRYADELRRAAHLERTGQRSEATRVVAALAEAYPQDYVIQLRLAWLCFQDAAYDRAERHYRAALRVSPQSRDAQHGLAWCLLRRGAFRQARVAFEAVLQRWPDIELARTGWTLAARSAAQKRLPSVRWSSDANFSTQLYRGHPVREAALGPTASLSMGLLHGVRLGLTYRATHYWVTEPWQPVFGTGFVQQELFAVGGIDRATWGLMGGYAYLNDGSGTFDYTHLWGLSGRFSVAGIADLSLAYNMGLYPDLTVHRIAPSVRVTPLTGLAISVTTAVQVVDGDAYNLQLNGTSEALASIALAVSVSRKRTRLWLGARAGDQVRPADLDLAVACNSLDRVSFGMWVGFAVQLSAGWNVYGAYELARLDTPISPVYRESSQMNLITLGATWVSAVAPRNTGH